MASTQQSVIPYSQYSYRAQKDIGFVSAVPLYQAVDAFQKPEGTARATKYSPDGRYAAIALPNQVQVLQCQTGNVVAVIDVPNVIEISFSPKNTYLSTWERQQKVEDGSLHKNLRIWNLTAAIAPAGTGTDETVEIQAGQEVASFAHKNQDGWELQFTPSESHALRLAGPEIQVYNPQDWANAGNKLRIEGMTSAVLSPGANPSVAVFLPEKKGSPASVRIHSLQAITAPPSCQKSFFKADRVTIKWNTLGTLALVMTQTEVDKSNKSYYGETQLYLLSAAGNFDSRIILDKEGPIHDFAWNPNSKEFCVVYGFMPAKATLFDQRVRPVYEFGANPNNFVSWNPQGRLMALAGFGNLAGKIVIWDRRTLNKLAEIDAPNTSHFEWSHDGLSILTATLSPRLRVDNGIKLWWCNGKLLHVHNIEELYQANFRPTLRNSIPPFPNDIPPPPAPSSSVQALPEKPVAAKPAGAYRPPGAQGRAAPSIFKREDEGGSPGSGANTPPRGVPGSMQYFDSGVNGHGRGGANGFGRGAPGPRGRGQGGRYVPGAAPSTPPAAASPPATAVPGAPGASGASGDSEKAPRRKKGKGRKEDGDALSPPANANANGGASGRQTPLTPDGRATPQSHDRHGSHGHGHGRPGLHERHSSGPGGGGRGGRPHSRAGDQGERGERGERPERERGKIKLPMPPKADPALLAPPPDITSPVSPGDGSLDPVQKKIRNLNKKLKAIEELKEKAKRGEKLETTQHKKIETEVEIRKELNALLSSEA